MDELLSLKWKNHSSTLLKLLCNILTKDLYCDATIVCHGKYYPVHRLILSTCSDYFKDIFARAQCKHPFIIINDVEPSEMEALLNFMYKGEVNVLQQAVSLLIKAAEALKIKGLAVPDDSGSDDELNSCERLEKKTNRHTSRQNKEINRSKKDDNYKRGVEPLADQGTENNIACLNIKENNGSLIRKMSKNSSKDRNEGSLLSQEEISQLKTEPEDYESASTICIKTCDEAGNLNAKVEDSFDTPISEELHRELESHSIQSLSFIPRSENVLVKSTEGIGWAEDDESATSSSNAFEEPSPEELMTSEFGEISSCLLSAFPQNSYADRLNESLCETDFTEAFCQSSVGESYASEFGESSNGRTILRKSNESSSGAILFTKEYIDSISKEITICPYCSSECQTEKKMRRHIIELHPGQNRFFCRLCNYSCKGNWHLRRHMLQHTGEKPYHCFICPFKTTTKQALNYHVFSHAGVKPFRCVQCPYKSTSLRGLKYHKLKYHPDAQKQNLENSSKTFGEIE